MPIYAYKCSVCGHAQDVLQKMSDAPLTTCPACHQDTYAKQVTAAGFQLKGSGWYVTDFRSNGAPSSAPGTSSGAASTASTPSTPTSPSTSTTTATETASASQSSSTSSAAPASTSSTSST